MAEAHPTRLGPPPAPLPVVDVIGLRFSLQQLRLAGYGLMAVWLVEITSLLSAPDLSAIGSRLHFISQFLDLAPILLVAIGLIAFQGGLRRNALEHRLLPLLLSLLPLLSAVHFFLAPVSLANAVTLVHKQQQLGDEQIGRIERQFDRASVILRESDSIGSLLDGLQRIPGLQVQVPAEATMGEARRQVRSSLEYERDRLRKRIRTNLRDTREAFLRRAATTTALALVVGLVLWSIHHGTMREIEQAIPFLDWVLVHGEAGQAEGTLQELLRFQRACVSLGWFAMLERSVRLVRRVVRRGPEEEAAETDLRVGTIEESAPPPAYPPPAPAGRSRPTRAWGDRPPPRSPQAFEAIPGEPAAPRPAPVPQEPADDGFPDSEPEADPPSFWQRRRRERDLRRAREALKRMGESAFFEELQGPDPPEWGSEPDLRFPDPKASERSRQRAREAFARMGAQEELARMGSDEPLPDPLPPLPPPHPRPGVLGRLWRWFVTHL